VTRHRRHQRAAGLGAVLLAAAGIGCGLHELYPHAALLGLGVLVLTEAALRASRRHRREIAEHDAARQRALGEWPAPLFPCCLLGQSSHGRAHAASCTDYTRIEFDDIVARLDPQHREN
jgi:hypothetical protein